MAARKGIKAKIAAWLEANPYTVITGREIEQMYVDHGGAFYPQDHPRKERRNRVSQDTMRGLIGSLPIKKVIDGQGGRGGKYGRGVERATYVFDRTSRRYRPSVVVSRLPDGTPTAIGTDVPSTNPDGSWIDSP